MRHILLCLLLSGCVGIDMREAERREEVTIRWHRVPDGHAACEPILGSGGIWLGCYRYYKATKTCVVWMRSDAPDFVVAHEFKHCFGWDHGR